MKKVLVLGASGYIGSGLLPLLLQQGYTVTAATRDINALSARISPHPALSITYLDLADAQATHSLVPHFDLIFFLVHGMAQGKDFVEYEIDLAENVKNALINSQVKQVIYLSAIQPKTGNSKHLDARKMTGKILRQAGIPIIELRAGVIVGSGSAAYEIMRDFVYNLPMLITPKSVDSKANPIALSNLNYYLLQIAQTTFNSSITYEVGGPDILSYKEQLQIICQQANKPYRLWSTPFLTVKMASFWLGLITSVPSNIGKALLEGLQHDFIANNEAIQAHYPQTLISYKEVIEDTVKSEGKFIKSNVWGFDPAAYKRWQPSFGYYPKKAKASKKTKASAHLLWQVIQKIGSEEKGYYFATFLWRLREWLDFVVGGGTPKKISPTTELNLGDYIDSWKVIRCEENKFLSLLFGLKAPGLGRLEFTIDDSGSERTLTICAWWHPKGFQGLLYWFAMMPAHLLIFQGMASAMIKEAERAQNAPTPPFLALEK